MTGKTESEMTKELAYHFQIGVFEARRLVRTESNFAYTQAEMLSYEECECDTYVFLATLDLMTSDICRSSDMQRFKLTDQQPGKNCPPMYPFCRSTTIAGLDDRALAKLKRRARDSETGKTYTVPGNMSYSEWMKQQQDKHGKDTVDILQKKIKNRSADKKQMQRYKDVLGDEFIPDSLDKFQQMKYNDAEKWKDLKYKYRTVNRYKIDYGHVDSSTILELDHEAFTAKDKYMTTRASKGNVASMKMNDNVYIAGSRISFEDDKEYINYKGNKNNLLLYPRKKRLHPHTAENLFKNHEHEYTREFDTEYKFFEFIYDKVLKGEVKNKEITILSQKSMCFSCDSVYNELINKLKEIDEEVKINVVSGKKNDLWNYRKYTKQSLNNQKYKKKEKVK